MSYKKGFFLVEATKLGRFCFHFIIRRRFLYQQIQMFHNFIREPKNSDWGQRWSEVSDSFSLVMNVILNKFVINARGKEKLGRKRKTINFDCLTIYVLMLPKRIQHASFGGRAREKVSVDA